MTAMEWKNELNDTQLEYLPLITISIATIQTLLGIRDLFLFDAALLGPMLAFTVVATTTAVVIALLYQARRIPPSLMYPALFVSIAFLAARPIATLIINPAGESLYFTVTIIGSALSSLFVLSRRQFVVLNTCSITAWIGAALIYFSPVQSLLLLLACGVASAFGYLLLSKRIENLTLIFELKNRVETLESILPMCSGCKKTRDDAGNWMSVENYIESHEKGLQVSHGLCPDCKESIYGDYLRKSGKPKPA